MLQKECGQVLGGAGREGGRDTTWGGTKRGGGVSWGPWYGIMGWDGVGEGGH